MQKTQLYSRFFNPKAIFLFLRHITFLGSGGAWVIGGAWVVLGGCDSKQEAAFSASPSTTAAAVTSDDVTVQEQGSIIESFTVKLDSEESARPVHMLWALDNSGSMTEEIAGVRAGVKAFAEGLREHSKIKAAMITATQGGHGVEAATLQDAGIHVIDFVVQSLDQLGVLTTYLLRTHKLENDPTLSEDQHPMPAFALHPDSDFFQDPKALKAFVVVTDDGDYSQSRSFISLLQDIYGDLSFFRFFGFLDLKAPRLNDPSNPRVGVNTRVHGNTSYHHLVHELGGGKWHIVDISPAEWKQVLDQVQSKIVSEVLQKVFTLKHPVAEILEVKVGETILESSSYQLEGAKLHVTASHLKEGDQLKVSYNAKGS